MLPFGVTIPATVPQRLEIPEGLMNYPVFAKLQLGCHPVAAVQYTFIHKQYTERHKTNNT
jgi:hypothetical protein